ncbi:unnamed protein product, partial [Closterium sp. NIES-53]
MDVWGPARVRGQGHERYFLLVVDDYSRYTTIFPLRSKGEVPEVLIDWISGARCQLSERFGTDLPILHLHSDRGGDFSSNLLRAFCRAEGIRKTFTLPAFPQQNGIAKRRIGMVMDVARTSMIHAAAPHFLWPFAVQYAVHQINLQPRVSLPETTPILRWTGKVGDASAWQFYHPTSRHVLSSQDVTFDESVSYYRLFPYRAASLPPPPLFLTLGTPPVDRLPPKGPAPSGVSQVDPAEPVEVADDSGAARGAEPTGAGTGGAEPGGVEPAGAEPGGAEPERVESGGAELERMEPGGAEPGGTASWGAEHACAESGGSLGVPLRREPLSLQRLREWYARRRRRASSAAGVGAAGGAAGARAAGGAAGAGAAGVGAAGTGAADAGATGGAAGAGATGGAAGARAAGAAGPGGARTEVLELLELVVLHAVALQVLELVSHVHTVRTGRRVSRPRPPPVPGTHSMTLHPSTAPQRVPLLSPPASSLPDGPDPESDSLRAASPTVTRFLAPADADPLFESTAASALVGELVDFAAACRLDFATSLVAESAPASVCPPSVGGESSLGMDVLEDRQEEFECFVALVPHLVSMLLAPEGDPDALDIPTPRSYAEAIEGPYSSQWQAAMDGKMASWKSTGTYRVESGGAEPERVEPGGTEPGGTASWDTEPTRAESGGSPGVSLRREPLSPQRLPTGGAAGAGATGRAATGGAAGGAAGAGAARGAAGAGAARGAAGAGAAGAAGPGGARTGGTGAARAGGAAGVGAKGTGVGGAAGVVISAVSAVSRGAARPRPYYVPLLQQVLGLQPSLGPTPPLLSPPPVQSQSQLQPASPLPGPSPYSGPTRCLRECREPESRPVSPESCSESPVRTVRAGCRVLRPCPPPVPGTHSMTLRPSTAPQRVPLLSPPASSLRDGLDPESDSLRAASST